MFDGLPISGETETSYAEIVSAPDEAWGKLKRRVVCVDRLFRPVPVGESGAETIQKRGVVRTGFEGSLRIKRA